MYFIRQWFLLFSLFPILTGCATSPKPILINQQFVVESKKIIPHWNSVFFLSPKLSYKDVQTEKNLQPDQYGANITSKSIKDFIHDTVLRRGFQVLQENDLTSDQKIELTQSLIELSAQTERLLKKRKDKEGILTYLKKVYDTTGAEVAIALILRVKVGKGSYWDPNTGSIASSTSTSHLISSLVDLKTGEIVWKNQVFFRELPKGKILTKSLQSLFSTFPTK